MNKVVPIAITKPHWQALSAFFQSVEFNPLEGFADSWLKMDSPAAFPACLDLENEPIKNLEGGFKKNGTFSHVNVVFAVLVSSSKALNSLFATKNLTITKSNIEDETVAIISATLDDWYDIFTKYLVKKSNSEYNQILCQCLSGLEMMGFREMFINLTKIPTDTGTYYLEID